MTYDYTVCNTVYGYNIYIATLLFVVVVDVDIDVVDGYVQYLIAYMILL